MVFNTSSVALTKAVCVNVIVVEPGIDVKGAEIERRFDLIGSSHWEFFMPELVSKLDLIVLKNTS